MLHKCLDVLFAQAFDVFEVKTHLMKAVTGVGHEAACVVNRLRVDRAAVRANAAAPVNHGAGASDEVFQFVGHGEKS